jgi:uncharacterized DUF497 family protein
MHVDVVTRCNYNLRVRVTWDEAKRMENLRKHGIDFMEADALFEGPTITLEDDRFAYGEQRFVTFGFSEGQVLAVVHTEQDEEIRVISMRKATRREEQSYFSSLRD